MQRHARPGLQRHAQRPRGLDAIEIDDLAAVEHREVHRFADGSARATSGSRGAARAPRIQQRVERDAGQPRPRRQPASIRIAREQSGVLEHREHPVRRSASGRPLPSAASRSAARPSARTTRSSSANARSSGGVRSCLSAIPAILSKNGTIQSIFRSRACLLAAVRGTLADSGAIALGETRMNKPVELPQAVTGRMKMTPSEAFVETLVSRGVTDVFGIVGSAYMDALDLFPLAGIRFISVAHEQGGGHMADGYARVSGRHGVCIAQNGPGITNFVTSTAAAFWAHSPVVVITPETGSATLGLGGFQETEQLPIFSKITKYQAHVNNKARMAELTGRAFDRAMLEMGPTQLNIPRDFFYGDIECEIPRRGRDRSRRRRRAQPRRRGGVARGGAVPRDHRRRRHRHGERSGGSRRARRAAAGAGRNVVSAQRRVPVAASAVVRTARLPGQQGGDEAAVAGGRRARARARGWDRSARCRSTASTTGRSTRRSCRSTPTRRCSAWSSRSRWASAAMRGRRHLRSSRD